MRTMVGLGLLVWLAAGTPTAALTLGNVPSLSSQVSALRDPDAQVEAIADGLAKRSNEADGSTLAARALRRDSRRLKMANPSQRDTPPASSLLGIR